MKFGKWRSALSLLLAILTVIPLFGLSVFAAETEQVLYSQDFERFSSKEGKKLTQEDGFGTTMPSTATVKKDALGTFMTIDFASGHSSEEMVYYTKNGGTYTLVPAGTEGAIYTDKASYGLTSGDDPNCDRNVVVQNPEISYREQSRLLIECSYYLSEDAKGTIQSQFWKFRSGSNSGNFLNLFQITAETGMLNVSGTHTEMNKLTKGAWNTITLDIDMETGDFDTYLNHCLASKGGYLGRAQLTLPEDSLIIAKIPRTNNTEQVAADVLSGYFAVDDVCLYTAGSNAVYALPETDKNGNAFLYADLFLNGRSLGQSKGEWVLNTRGIKITPHFFSLEDYGDVVLPADSAVELRMNDPFGIRFNTKVNIEKYLEIQKLIDDGVVRSVRIGTLIAPVSYIQEAGAFTKEALEKLKHKTNYLEVSYDMAVLDERIAAGEKNVTFSGSLVGLQLGHFDMAFAGIGFVEVKSVTGATLTAYAAYEEGKQSAKASDLVAAAEKNPDTDYTEEQLKAIHSYQVKKAEVPSDSGVSDVRYTNSAIYFKVVSTGIYCRLTYTGAYGWRLQAQADDFDSFTTKGAAQALSAYMNEHYSITPEVIGVSATAKENTLTVTCADGTRAELAIGKSFGIRFYSPSGKMVSGITGVSADQKTGNITLTGTLEKYEGVFGGGERFDTVNKYGTTMTLYTSDMWNNSAGTYMAIPLFLMTRGAGLYINRYESMTVSFGLERSPEAWTVALKHDLMDCYIFASGDMKDALTGYTELTGHAEMPDEWNYGAVICRYGPDFNHLYTADDVPGRTNKDGAPGGRGFQTIVEGFLNAGMPVKAVITEGWGYYNIAGNQREKAAWQEAVDWLHAKGIKVMVYTRVASTIPTGAGSGYSENYLLRARITKDGVTKTTYDIPDIGGDGVNPDAKGSSTHRYIDITNPAAMKWYVDTIWGELIDMGFDGVKIDFCETMPDAGYNYNGTVVEFDWYDPSRIERGTEHHAYPTFFISAFYRRMNELMDEKYGDKSEGFMVLTRGGGIGSQRNPFLWAGDQARQFDKLYDQLMATINSGLSGVPFMTYDMAGYRYNGGIMGYNNAESLQYESRIFSRAVEFTAFTTCIQTHGTVRSAFELEGYAQRIYKNYLAIHDQLTNYFTKLNRIACETGVPAARHLVLNYQNDGYVYNIKDEFMLGDGLLVAPILEDGATSRKVYLPEGNWTNLLTGETIQVSASGKTIMVNANIAQIPLFLNNDSEDAAMLKAIFEGTEWTAIKNWKD